MKILRKIQAKISTMQQRALEKQLYKMLGTMAGVMDCERDSSITASMLYPHFCALVASDDKVFRNFRQNPIYTAVLEHTSYEIGAKYLQIARDSFSKSDFENFKRNDVIGGGNSQI